MLVVKVTCDRCGNVIEGYDEPGMTDGFYRVEKGSWMKFANAGEKIVCDDCMWKDPRYIAVYGRHSRQGGEVK